MRLVVGLGNPGPRYAGTRHNAGFLVLDAYAQRHGATFRDRRYGAEARAHDLRLLKPNTFMNLSGKAVQAAAARHSIPPAEILVIHDDIDLPLGRLRVRVGGGAGGQRGVRDVIDRLGPAFARLKIGIDRPPPQWTVEHWVLSRFREDEAERVRAVAETGADVVDRIVREGPTAAANAVNGLDLRDPAPATPANDPGEGEP
ncbi:MAG: aminoacyl-tRNA hydrolase [Trueperaceae bacterium]|nr:aminoacyl-tRNA hydrolase [Trueperaceae bacterium]